MCCAANNHEQKWRGSLWRSKVDQLLSNHVQVDLYEWHETGCDLRWCSCSVANVMASAPPRQEVHHLKTIKYRGTMASSSKTTHSSFELFTILQCLPVGRLPLPEEMSAMPHATFTTNMAFLFP